MKKNFVFRKLSPELEEVLMEELHTLKGGNGGGSDGSKWDGDLKEVEIVGEAPPPDPPAIGDGDNYPDPEPEEDPDWDDDWGGDSNPDEPEPQCTCELGPNETSSQIPEITDTSSILANFKNFISETKNGLKNPLPSMNIPQAGIDKMNRDLNFLSTIITTMEDSGKSFRFQTGTVDGPATGAVTKDVANNVYVITIDPAKESFSNNSMLAHELVHVNQILSGQLGFDENGNPTMYGIEDEVQAYQIQYSIEAGAYESPKIATSSNVLSDFKDKNGDSIYKNLPKQGGKRPVHK